MLPESSSLIGDIIKLIGKILIGVFKLFSIAILYAIVGVVLYAVWDFNPFGGDLFAVLYLVGFGLCVILSILLAFRKKSKKGKKKSEPSRKWEKEDEEEKLGWWERRKEKKRIEEEQAREKALKQEKLEREENLREQERKLEELRAERLKEEIVREERLIEGYRQEAALSALNRYEETVSAYPLPNDEESLNSYSASSYNEHKVPKKSPLVGYDEVNYFGGFGSVGGERERGKFNYQETESPLKRRNNSVSKIDEKNYFSALNMGYEEPKQRSYEPKPITHASKEEPKIYLSAVEENTLIYEYSDRFEVYRLNGGEKTYITTERKER